MPDTTNHTNVSGNDSGDHAIVFPDTVLQTLDRRVGKKRLYFDRRLFEATVDAWNGVPIFYQNEAHHPQFRDFGLVNRDPEAAAKAIQGEHVGYVSNPRIVLPGGARLMVELDIDAGHPEIEELWNEGKLFPSSGFTADYNDDRLLTPPIPNHVLLFPVEVDKATPGDYGAFVNTMSEDEPMKKEEDKKKSVCNAEGEMTTQEPVAEPAPAVVEAIEEVTEEVTEKVSELDELKAELEALKMEIAGIKQAVEQPAPAAVTNSEPPAEIIAGEVVDSNDGNKGNDEELQSELKAKNEEIAALKAEISDLKKKIAEMEALAVDHEFSELVEKLPVGMKAKPEQVEALRADFKAGNMKAMLFSVLENNAASGETRRIGQPFLHSNIENTDSQAGVGDLSKPKNRRE